MSRPTESETVAASGPIWSEMVRERTSSSRSDCSSSQSLSSGGPCDTTRITVSQAPAQDDERPLDFLHLFSLVHRVWSRDHGFQPSGNISMLRFDSLGAGLSFEVSLHPIGEGVRDIINASAEYDVGNKMAIKGLKFVDDYNNNVAKKSLYNASLREIRALTHSPLRSHPNIITLLGVGWEPDQNHHDVAWPVLMLEYSEEGTLRDYQRERPGMEFLEKMQFCEDVGRALLAIHGSGIVHGDVKSENILVFWSAEKGRMVGKVGDFGSSVLDFREDEHRGLPAHTIPWNAPEYDEDIPRERLKFTDVYSFGMLIFRVMLGGINPFKIAPFESKEIEIERRSQELKKDPEFLSLVAVMLCERCDGSEAEAVCEVLRFALQYLPAQRNLERAVVKICELRGGIEDIPPATPLEEFHYEDIIFNIDCMRGNSFCIRASIIHGLEAVASSNSVHAHQASSQLFQLLVNRYGTGIESASDMAQICLMRCLRGGGYDKIGHLVGRIFDGLGVQLNEEIPFQALLEQGALKGSHTAFEDLKKYYPEAYDETLALFRECGGGRGMVQRCALFPWVDVSGPGGIMEAIENSPGVELCDIYVSEDEDTLLHCAARSGYLEGVRCLIGLGIGVNVINRLGETPLLEASRAGHYEGSMCLMEAGARADKTSIFGEGPIHFLPFFDEQHIDSVSELMVRNGADVDQLATENPGEGEQGCWGHSPLHYAVERNHIASIRALLRLGADPYAKGDDGSAILWACSLSRAEALDMMAAASSRGISSEDSRSEFLERTVLGPFNRLENIIEHGGNHENATIDTLRVLQKYEAINHGDIGGFGDTTVLHYAALAGYPRMVDYLLSHTPSKQYLDTLSNKNRTPLMDVIIMGYRDVFEVLLHHGADIHLKFPAVRSNINYLHVCALAGHRDLFFPEQLLKRGVEIDWVDESGQTPFGEAVIQGNYPVADLLLQYGADRDYLLEGITILARCLAIPLPLKRIKYMMTCKSNPESPPPSFICSPGSGQNVFHAIALAGEAAENSPGETRAIFQYLQELWPGKEHINACDRRGNSPLVIAVRYPKLDLISMMIAAGADPNLGPMPPLYRAYMRQNWANGQIGKVGGRWMTRRIKKIADTVVKILEREGARVDMDPHTGRLTGFDMGSVLGGLTDEEWEEMRRDMWAGIRDSQAGVTERYGWAAENRKGLEYIMSRPGASRVTGAPPLFRLRESSSQSSAAALSDQTAEASGRSQTQITPANTEGNRRSNWGERSEKWKSELEKVPGTVVDGINGVQLPMVGSGESSSRVPEMPANPGRGISQLSSSRNDLPLPACEPHPREPEVSTNTRGVISQLFPSGNSLSVRTYRPPPKQLESPPDPLCDIPQRSPSNTTSTGSSYRSPPRQSIRPARRSPPPSLLDTPVPSSLSPNSQDILLSAHGDTLQLPQLPNHPTLENYRPQLPSGTASMGSSYKLAPRRSIVPARRSPPPSLLDTPAPSSLSPNSQDILLSAHEDTLQLPQLTNSSTLENYHSRPPRPVLAPQYSSSEAPSSSPEPSRMTTPPLTCEAQLALATSPPQASSQSLQSLPRPQDISQLSPALQPTPHADHQSTSPSFPRHIPCTIPHQQPPHEILDSLRPAVLPLITTLVDSRRSHIIPRHNLKICLENHLCVPNLIDLKWDLAAPLGSSSVKDLQSGVNEMLKGFSIIIRLKLRVEMDGESGTRTMLRVLMNEDGGCSGGEGWLGIEGAGWEELERIEAGIMFPGET